jgi:regulator of protease activity HflC (stomatin/prohibitin superfamily)
MAESKVTTYNNIELSCMDTRDDSYNANGHNDICHLRQIDPKDEALIGIRALPDILTPPEVYRDDDCDDSTLPVEKHPRPLEELVVAFPTVSRRELDECRKKYYNDSSYIDRFNDINQAIVRDSDNKINTHHDMVEKINEYDHVPCDPGIFGGVAATLLSCFIYPCCRRKIIDPDKFGHYVVNGQHMLTEHTRILWSTNARWIGENGQIPKDNKENDIVRIGSKFIVNIREGYIGGAHRLIKTDKNNAGDYVILNQGRHVLKDTEYRDIQVVQWSNSTDSIITLGPLTILNVREGYVAGANSLLENKFKLFYPGPPYILHSKNYSQIDCVKIGDANGDGQFNKDDDNAEGNIFKIGQVTFVTVKEGWIGGAYHSPSGLFQVLPQGHTYNLHEKNYYDIILEKRADEFTLGPYYYVKVKPGYVAGAFRRKEGNFVDFPPGQTYQCNTEDYEKPILVKRDKHMVVCGPKTYLTINRGFLHGAYRVDNGKFEIFENDEQEIVLHEEIYRDVIVIPKYDNTVNSRNFGPYKVTTVSQGYAGVVTKEGHLEILEVGFHRLGSEYIVHNPIPLNTFTLSVKDLPFSSKDSLAMRMSANFIWQVDDPKKVVLYPGRFESLNRDIDYQVRLALRSKCTTYNRDEILPTKHDIYVNQENNMMTEENIEELFETAKKDKLRKYKEITDGCMEQLSKISVTSDWGIVIKSISIELFELCDEQVLHSFENIARSITDTKAQKVRSHLVIEQANTEKEIKIKQADAEAVVNMRKAEADAQVKMQQARANADVEMRKAETDAQVKMQQAKANADVEITNAEAAANAGKASALARAQASIHAAKADAEVQREKALAETDADKIRAKVDTEVRETRLAIAIKEKIDTAMADANAIKSLADAEFFKRQKENETSKDTPAHEIELRQLQVKANAMVESANHYGQAVAKNPMALNTAMDKINEFFGIDIMQDTRNRVKIVDARENGNLTVKTGTHDF